MLPRLKSSLGSPVGSPLRPNLSPSKQWYGSFILPISTSLRQPVTTPNFPDFTSIRPITTTTLSSPKLLDNLSVKCTVFDAQGKMVAHGQEFTRIQFQQSYGVIARDFRKLVRHHGLVDMVPTILIRPELAILNIVSVRALIKKDTVVIFDGDSDSRTPSNNNSLVGINGLQTQGIFLRELQHKLQDKLSNEPYEFRALEAILVHVTQNLATEMKVHQTVLGNILSGLEKLIDRVKLRYLLIQLKKITQFHQKAKLLRDLLDEIVQQDDELNELYFSEKAAGTPRLGPNHAEVEMLIEVYSTTTDEIVQTAENLRQQIKTTEEIINIVLDSNRNELMLLGLKFLLGILLMGSILWVAALYGMNLENFIEEFDGGFEVVIVVSLVVFVIMFKYSRKKLQLLEKVTMTGHTQTRHKP